MSTSFPLFPPSASSVATEMNLLYLFIAAISAFFVVLVAALVVFFTVKYRRRHAAEVGADIHGSLVLELTWTVIPFVLALVMFGWGADLFFRLARPPVNAMEIFVVGKQWMWKIQHPEGVREINELHVPLGRPVRITLGSEDVVHSFGIPAFRVKMDAVPGRWTTMWFTATEAGTYHIFCNQYCGTKHAGMVGQVIAMPETEYEAWLAGGKSNVSAVDTGERLFTELSCHTCHKDASDARGPALKDLFGSTVQLTDGRKVVADDAYLRESIMNPQGKVVQGYQPIMPAFQGMVSEENLMQLVAYLKSRKTKPATTAAPTPHEK